MVYCDYVICDSIKFVLQDFWSEYVYVYILDSFYNIDSLMINNFYLVFGVIYNGIDYDIFDIKIDMGVCFDKQDDKWGDYKEVVCNGVIIQKNIIFSVCFCFYVKLKVILKEQFDYIFFFVIVLMFDGLGGINMFLKVKNLYYDIIGLLNIYFLDCGVDIWIYFENQIVNFGQFMESVVNVNVVILLFSILIIWDVIVGCLE